MPGTAPQRPPQAVAASRQTHQGSFRISAQYRPPKAPSTYWPAAPMLNRPVLKAKATERPVIISGAASAISMPRGLMWAPVFISFSLPKLLKPPLMIGSRPSFQADLEFRITRKR